MFNSLEIGIFEAVLILRAADAVIDGQVLHRLHEQPDALHFGQLRLQTADDFASRWLSAPRAASS